MKLQYRGTTYQQQTRQIETIDSGINCNFLGQTYHLRRSNITPNPKLGLHKYRGIYYGS